jgi:hypothetical protein
LNAICGWIVTFAIMHEMVNRAGMMGIMRTGIASTMLSPSAVLLAGIGSLASSAVLKTSLDEEVAASPSPVGPTTGLQDFLDEHIFHLGIVGCAVWALSLCILGMTTWCSEKPVRLASVCTLLACLGLTLFMSSGILSGIGPGSANGLGEGLYPPVSVTARRLRGESDLQ